MIAINILQARFFFLHLFPESARDPLMVIFLKQEDSVPRSKICELLLILGNSDGRCLMEEHTQEWCVRDIRVWRVLDFCMGRPGSLTHNRDN